MVYKDTYPTIKKEYIETGIVKLIIRHLTHSSKANSLYAVKSSEFAMINGVFDQFTEEMVRQYPKLDAAIIQNFFTNAGADMTAFGDYLSDPEIEKRILSRAQTTRNYGINQTPTFFIGTNKIIGTRSIERFRVLIGRELEKTNTTEFD